MSPIIWEVSPQEEFYRNLLTGIFFKGLVTVILEQARYEVYPYGYESFITPIKIAFHERDIRSTPTARRVRSTPDLLVYDRDDRNVILLEVKSRDFDDPRDVWLNARQLRWYKRYWPESIVVVIIPGGHYFYAQRAGELQNISGDRNINLREEFEWFEKVFVKVSTDALYRFKDDVINLFKRRREPYFPEEGWYRKAGEGWKKGEENQQLLEFIQTNPSMTLDILFENYNKVNLVSREIFDRNIKVLQDSGKI